MVLICVCWLLGLIFINTWFMDFFSQNIKVVGGKKIKIKITKKIFFILSETYLDQRKNNNKICMILHCKNAEITIKLSFLLFYIVKSYNFCYFFLIFNFFFKSGSFFYIGESKKSQK